MAVTFAIEIAMAVYVVWRYKLNAVSRLAALLLLFLAAFQLAEFMVCTGSASTTMWWTRLGNYVIFELAPWAGGLYTLYYYGWLAIGIALATHFARHIRRKRTRLALIGLIAGYGAFIIPTVAVNLVSPDTIRGIPSIMCGFAVLFAFILVGWVLPMSHKKKRA